MKLVEPILVIDLFPKLHTALMDLLADLTPEEWTRPTACEGWSVKDIAAHLLADDLGLLSRKRDQFNYLPPVFQGLNFDDWEQLLIFINHNNKIWVEAARRLSPQILLSLLANSGEEVIDYFQTLDPFELGEPVNWAGNAPAPVWLDLAREYTERWLHQQHIRDAVDKPGLKEPELFSPVIDAFVRATPHTYREVEVGLGTTVTVEITGGAGDTWTLKHEEGGWMLYLGESDTPDAKVKLDEETAWRLFTKGVSPEEAEERAVVEGDEELAMRFFNTVSILA